MSRAELLPDVCGIIRPQEHGSDTVVQAFYNVQLIDFYCFNCA